jgi:hypothetical protein
MWTVCAWTGARELIALVAGNVRRRWTEWRNRRALASQAVIVEIDSSWRRASGPRPHGAVKAAPAALVTQRVLGGATRRSAHSGSAAPTSSLADDLRGSLVRTVR